MHSIIHCLDRPDAVDLRLAHYEAHKACLAASRIKTVISGPLLADDNQTIFGQTIFGQTIFGQTMNGSCFVVEADSLAEVQAFNAGDPFKAADLWQTISIRPFLKRVDNRA